MLPKGTDMDDEDAVRVAVAELIHEQSLESRGCIDRILDCTIVPILRMFDMELPPDVLVDKAFKLKEDIQQLQKAKYDVCSVFITFETEEGQRAALTALAIGKVDLLLNNKSHVAPGTLFKDRILKVMVPPDPTSVRYLDLSSTTLYKVSMRIANFFATIAILALTGLAALKTRENLGTRFYGPLVSIFNVVIPVIIKVLMIFERHISQGSFQASLYLKITLFRWINTAVLTKITTPFTSTVSPESSDVLAQVGTPRFREFLFFLSSFDSYLPHDSPLCSDQFYHVG